MTPTQLRAAVYAATDQLLTQFGVPDTVTGQLAADEQIFEAEGNPKIRFVVAALVGDPDPNIPGT